MFKKIDLKKSSIILLVLILGVISGSLSFRTTNLLYPNYEFMIDTRNVKNHDVKIGFSNFNGIKWTANRINNMYKVEIPTTICPQGGTLLLKINESTNQIGKAYLNNREISNNNIKALNNFALDKSSYLGFSVVKVGNQYQYKKLFSIIFFVIIWVMLVLIFLQTILLYRKYGGCIKYLPIYSQSSLKYIKFKDIVFSFSIFIITFFMIVGVDATGIYQSCIFYNNGLDIYQLQVNIRQFTNFQFPSFPYNPLMLYFWTDIVCIWDNLFHNFHNVNGYPYFQIGILKLVNIILLIITILSVLSFLIDEKIIDCKKARTVYYLSLFNPISFYIAIMYIQVDTLPMYLLTLGLILLKDVRKNCYISSCLLSAAFFTKVQILMLLPTVGVAIFIIIFICNKMPITQKIKVFFTMIIIFLFVGMAFFFLHYQEKYAFYNLLKNFPQTQRIWFTVIPYAQGLYLYISLFIILVFLMLNWFRYKSELSQIQIIMNTIMINATIVLVFSFSILNTPSIILHTTPAFILLYTLKSDLLENLIIFLLSSFVIVSFALSDGDISRIWYGWNGVLLFNNRIALLDEAQRVKINSILFTISNTSMLVYGMLFYDTGKKLIKNNCYLNRSNKINY